MEDIVYRYGVMQGSNSNCIDISQGSLDPQNPVVVININGNFVLLEKKAAQLLAMRIADIATPVDPKPY